MTHDLTAGPHVSFSWLHGHQPKGSFRSPSMQDSSIRFIAAFTVNVYINGTLQQIDLGMLGPRTHLFNILQI